MSKIIFINNLGLGGAERVVSRLFTNSKVSKHVTLWTLSDELFYKIELRKTVNLCKSNGFLTYFNVIKKMLKLNSDSVLQAHLNKPILLSALSKCFGGKFSLQAVHCFAYSGFYLRKGFLGLVHKLIFSWLLKKVDLHIFKSHEMVDDFCEVFNWKPENYSVIYNPYDFDNIKLMASVDSEKSVNIDAVPIDVAVIGRLNSSKRPFDVLDVAERTDGIAIYHLLGEGPLRNELELAISNRNISNVKLHGMVENPFKYLKQFGFYLSCSESEGFPNALIEAMACDAIPIHSDCKTGPKEILCSDYKQYKPFAGEFCLEEKGLLFPVGDISAAKKAIMYAAKNKYTLKAKFCNANKFFLRSIETNNITNKYFETLSFGELGEKEY